MRDVGIAILQLCCPQSACLRNGRLAACLEGLGWGQGPGTYNLEPLDSCAHLPALPCSQGKGPSLLECPLVAGGSAEGPLGPQPASGFLTFLLISGGSLGGWGWLEGGGENPASGWAKPEKPVSSLNLLSQEVPRWGTGGGGSQHKARASRSSPAHPTETHNPSCTERAPAGNQLGLGQAWLRDPLPIPHPAQTSPQQGRQPRPPPVPRAPGVQPSFLPIESLLVGTPPRPPPPLSWPLSTR